jgi:ABC-2 type transport system ATP-binding protein
LIQLNHLRKEYDETVAVSDLSLGIPPGEIYGLIGPNGAGKTTTIRMACGLLTPTAGTVTVSGVDVLAEPEKAQQFIGYLSDFFSLYDDLKVWEYLDYFAHAYRMPDSEIPMRVEEVITQMDLGAKRNAMIRGLSRGMKQRLGIARAVIHRPQVLLLDEPASGLDPKSRIELRNLLRDLRDGGSTVLISSHILTELEGFCTSIGIMEKGQLVKSGKIEDITVSQPGRRTVRVTWSGDFLETAARTIASFEAASAFKAQASESEFQFAGSDEGLAEILAALVSAGVRVTSFAESKQTVEELYMAISQHQVT